LIGPERSRGVAKKKELIMAEADLLKGKKILIVDDEPDVLSVLEELLDMCDTVKASSFEEAREFLQSQDFDFAILDIMGVNGFQLLDIANGRKIRAIMLTAHSLTIESTIKSYKRGAAYFVPKDEIARIVVFLEDILEASRKGENYWTEWLDRLGAYYERRFGPDWKDKDRQFWEALAKHEWRLASVLRKEEAEE
jgi:CheY-like chemotaxis protein